MNSGPNFCRRERKPAKPVTRKPLCGACRFMKWYGAGKDEANCINLMSPHAYSAVKRPKTRGCDKWEEI